jgi:hypothetical protein
MSWAAVGGAAVGVVGNAIGGGKGESAQVGVAKELKPLLGTAGSNADDFANQYGSGEGLYSGNRLGDQSQYVGQGQQQQLDAAGLIGSGFGGANQALEGFLDYDPNSAQNVASRDALSANVNAMFNESIRPGIEDRSTMSGQFGGPQSAVALGSATAPLSRAIADSEVGLMNADRNRAMQALGLAPGIINGQLNEGLAVEGVGNRQTARDQLTLDDLIQMSEAERNNALRGNEDVAGLFNTLQGGAGKTVQSNPGQGTLAQGALGGFLAGGGMNSIGGIFNQPNVGVENDITSMLNQPGLF